MSIKAIPFLLVLLVSIQLSGQTKSGSLQVYLSEYLESIPESIGNQYTVPSNENLAVWKDGVQQLLSDDLQEAKARLELLNYQIIEYTDTSNDPTNFYYILEETEPRQFFGGTFIFTLSICSEFVTIQAPHTQFDSNTGLEAVHCFSRISSGALMLAGTHRCNSNLSSSCDGTTSACGSSEPYRQSDLAHTQQSFFQATTEAISIHHSSSVFVQLHGFSKSDSDPYVIMSNGSRTTPIIDYTDILKDQLRLVDPSLTFRVAHSNLAWTRLIGFTNVQGRYLNNSTDPCEENAEGGTGRFIHIEQERGKLRENEEGWEKMARALAKTFNCSITTAIQNSKIAVFPTIVKSGYIHVEGFALKKVSLFNHFGSQTRHWDCAGKEAILDVSDIESGLYFIRIVDGDSQEIQKVVLAPN